MKQQLICLDQIKYSKDSGEFGRVIESFRAEGFDSVILKFGETVTYKKEDGEELTLDNARHSFVLFEGVKP